MFGKADADKHIICLLKSAPYRSGRTAHHYMQLQKNIQSDFRNKL